MIPALSLDPESDFQPFGDSGSDPVKRGSVLPLLYIHRSQELRTPELLTLIGAICESPFGSDAMQVSNPLSHSTYAPQAITLYT